MDETEVKKMKLFIDDEPEEERIALEKAAILKYQVPNRPGHFYALARRPTVGCRKYYSSQVRPIPVPNKSEHNHGSFNESASLEPAVANKLIILDWKPKFMLRDTNEVTDDNKVNDKKINGQSANQQSANQQCDEFHLDPAIDGLMKQSANKQCDDEIRVDDASKAMVTKILRYDLYDYRRPLKYMQDIILLPLRVPLTRALVKWKPIIEWLEWLEEQHYDQDDLADDDDVEEIFYN